MMMMMKITICLIVSMETHFPYFARQNYRDLLLYVLFFLVVGVHCWQQYLCNVPLVIGPIDAQIICGTCPGAAVLLSDRSDHSGHSDHIDCYRDGRDGRDGKEGADDMDDNFDFVCVSLAFTILV